MKGGIFMNGQNPYEENLQNVLEKYGRDITKSAKDGKIDPVIGRDDEIRSITRVLSRKTKNNPVLIGEPGVGKTAIIEGLAMRIIKGDVPNSLKDKTIWESDNFPKQNEIPDQKVWMPTIMLPTPKAILCGARLP